jgi:hypothetical protein
MSFPGRAFILSEPVYYYARLGPYLSLNILSFAKNPLYALDMKA